MDALTELSSSFAGRIFTDPSDMEPFLRDWRGQWTGAARAVLQPETVEDVAAAVRWCSANAVSIVPQGGNTGLSGGATPDASGTSVVLSLARMKRVRSVDLANDTITVDAGCILAEVQAAASEAGRFFPLSLAAEGSCTIGGNLATNAGGTAVLRYGNIRELCLGLEVVTAQGEVWDGLRGLRKDNSGYDLRDLFIASEGTLGIITGAVLRLFPQPSARVAAFAALGSPADAVALLKDARNALGSMLTAFELVSSTSLDMVVEHLPGRRSPFEGKSPWYVLLEISDLGPEERARELLETILANAFEKSWVSDAVVASSVAQSRALWELREAISEAQAAAGKAIKHDVALPISAIPSFLDAADQAVHALDPTARLVTFGHLGDGNLHYNLSPPPGDDGTALAHLLSAMNQAVHDIVVDLGGTFSAEHGLGQLRAGEAARYKSPVELDLMRRIKSALDPENLMNPGKVFA